jgi:hypothetical protein
MYLQARQRVALACLLPLLFAEALAQKGLYLLLYLQ